MIRPIGKRKRNCRDFWLSLRKVLSQKLHCDDCCRQTSLLEGNVTATLTNDGTVVSTKLNPLHHSTEHVGQYYTVPISDVSVLFSHGLPKSGYLDEMNTIGEFNLMIRKPALTILNALNIEEKRVKRIVIYGEDGCGKTLTLSHVIHNCYLKEWILLLLPSVFKMIHGRQNVIPSIYNPKRFDQTEVALTWLKSFQILNERFLSKIKTTKEYKISQKISIDTGSSIINVIDQAFHRPNFASDAVGITLKEVQCLSNRIPVLFAADEFNGLFWQTSLKNPENNERLKNKDLSLVKHFVKLFREDSSLAKGSYVVALSRTGMERSFCPSYHYSDLLRPKGLSTLGYFDPVNVPAYDEEELQKCLTYYHKKGIFSKDFSIDQTFKEVAYLTNRRPILVQKMVLPF
ncbi:28S ribosomal protein S29, mitochondrial-like [Xenia sp. Carnegie-2017]|uniref:28S ribosomal protein S29, mitochondrial-like n=1 Tax=Xenia sp. Carnegie-2017 TaxID=2897299 RepID=UPI001F037BA6|nr:28S ribosomal protein S29, mitochondrial-like [Xenia sp. Carnegie-2017]